MRAVSRRHDGWLRAQRVRGRVRRWRSAEPIAQDSRSDQTGAATWKMTARQPRTRRRRPRTSLCPSVAIFSRRLGRRPSTWSMDILIAQTL